MSLYPWIRNLVSRYSFITRTEFRLAKLYLYYEVEGKERYKVLPFRASKAQLERAIGRIKDEVDWYNTEKQLGKSFELMRKRPIAFAISTEL